MHEWFDTGEDAVDPFADPPRAPDVPAQRAAGVQVGGRNGVAREAGPEATAEADEPSSLRAGRVATPRMPVPAAAGHGHPAPTGRSIR